MEMEAWLLLVSRRGKRVPEPGVAGIWGDVGGHVVPVAGGPVRGAWTREDREPPLDARRRRRARRGANRVSSRSARLGLGLTAE